MAYFWRKQCYLLAGLALLAAGLALLPRPAQAQQAPSLASLEIALWPEFDKPSMLVILNGQVAAGVALPASLSVRLPAAAGAPNAVAVIGADGGLFETPYTTTQAGGDIIITFTSNSAGFRIEYYDPSLLIRGEARSFGLRWKSDMAIQAVSVRVQQPAGARGLSGRPGLTAAGAGEYGLSYYTAALGPLAAGGTVSFDLGYSKSDSVLSATAVANAPGGTPMTPAAGSGLPWGVIGALVGLVLIGGGVAWYVRYSPAAQKQPARRRSAAHRQRASAPETRAAQVRKRAQAKPAEPESAAAAAAAAAASDQAPAAFCPQCGRRYKAGDKFCRQCGAPVRT